jgi:hypothetical protein
MLSPAPILDIGTAVGAPEYLLFRVRGAIRLGDGRIAVANSGSSEIRFYDSTGIYLYSTGRAGGGPGEFKDLRWIAMFEPESIMAYDRAHQRISVFDNRGKYVRSWTLPTLDVPLFAVGLFDDGSVVARTGNAFEAGPKTGVVRNPVTYLLFTPQGALADTLGRFPGPEYFLWSGGGAFGVWPRAFGRNTIHAFGSNMLYVGTGDTYEIRVVPRGRGSERRIRKAQGNQPVTDRDIERYSAALLEQATRQGSRDVTRRMLAEMPFPETMPAYSQLSADEDGNLWVRDYTPIGHELAAWSVFSAAGELIATLSMPARLAVDQIGRGFILGRWRDDQDVEHVVMYRLIKP